MCLSNIFYIDSDGQQQEVMQDVARMEAHNNGFMLTGLLGEQKFVQGEVKSVDFVNKHSVVLWGKDTQSVTKEDYASF